MLQLALQALRKLCIAARNDPETTSTPTLKRKGHCCSALQQEFNSLPLQLDFVYRLQLRLAGICQQVGWAKAASIQPLGKFTIGTLCY